MKENALNPVNDADYTELNAVNSGRFNTCGGQEADIRPWSEI